MRSLFLCKWILAGWLAAAAVHAAALPPAFVAALQRANIPLDHVAVVVQPLDAATPWLAHQADAAMNPASVMKLVTSFAALAQLGPAFTWTTEIDATGPLENGRLDGDLVVRGQGDPSLTLERLWLMQRALRAQGVRQVSGGLVLDSRYFDLPETDPGAFDDEPFAPYNAPAGALVANFNAVSLRFRPVASEVALTLDPDLPGVTLVNRVHVDETAACNGWRDALTLAFVDAAQSELAVAGRYPRQCGEQAWPVSLFEPARTFDQVFRALWRESGDELGGTPAADGAVAAPLLRVASEPLADVLQRLNKHSNNVMTKNLFLTLGAQAYGAPGTAEKGARAVRSALQQAGIATGKLVLENGSGLSRIERISAAALNQVLRAAWRSPWYAEFESALPVVGQDGTLARRFNGSPANGRAHLKTGTLRDVSALAGVVFTARGQRVAFVMLVNHAHAAQATEAQRTLLEWTAADDGATTTSPGREDCQRNGTADVR
ncbi:MAG: D-alanyl-D-alanine carboxypeptidase/D-alanyl-D-alanine-endopeptidase [Hydrogenophilales bacterium 16-64-46]|nr:MAG: D-alanyl-D-alanine carboxypeptidase/D-alanyl-D-alanine-endopeptidase [Hydrogenophilales bacterium 12-64-13]OYZ06680.1 MAG: D-alanyl-D-alanine carboxypeptidase/D-alanyl-D-alanine-endopeptidase [Hydrogenophilales bacterium 16-64-46]OZA39388.1 MAG: D-alanyl-D-alanine carboxypeptidase/D-alanyl-D-alanine-endopeptidase [Hydrogenophilales bacterium 17-64-34]HQT01419.1 D-alanyl-D-alanine carboxypeptidase/D-alanyl-D-alanine-endopeptidase [Thiobacillus sp.]